MLFQCLGRFFLSLLVCGSQADLLHEVLWFLFWPPHFNFIGFYNTRPFSTGSFVWLAFLAGFSLPFPAGSGFRMDFPSSRCTSSSEVHPWVCFSRSCRLLVGFFRVVSWRPLFFGLIVRTGGANNVSHCATPVHGFLPPARSPIASFRPSVMKATQSTFYPSYTAMTKPTLYFGMAGGRGCTNPYSNSTRATSLNSRSFPPCVRYTLLMREYSPKYSNRISLDGLSTDCSPLACNPVRASIAPSVILDRSIVATAYSGSSCGGVSAIRRNPSKPLSVNHCLASSESAMGPTSSSLVRCSELGQCSVRLSALLSLRACHNENSQNDIPSHSLPFCRSIFPEPPFLDSRACIM